MPNPCFGVAWSVHAIFVVVVLLLGAPAAPAAIATGSIKRFGVVAVVADKFTRSYIGFTAFSNKDEEIDVSSWGLDAAYADQLGKVAAGVLGATYVAGPYASGGEFSKINQTSRRGAPSWSSIEAAVKTSCSANELDALLVISKDRGTMPGTSIARIPMGIQGARNGAYLRLSAAISVYDCPTGRMRETELLRFTPPGHLLWQLPQVQVSPDLVTHSLSEMDDTERDEIKSKLLGLPGPDWDQTLRRMVRTP